MMFMIPSSKGKIQLPQIAKGKIEKGETEQDAMYREVAEELGIKKTDIIKTKKFHLDPKFPVYALEVEKGVPQYKTDAETKKVIWLNELQVNKITKKHQNIVNHFLDFVKNKKI